MSEFSELPTPVQYLTYPVPPPVTCRNDTLWFPINSNSARSWLYIGWVSIHSAAISIEADYWRFGRDAWKQGTHVPRSPSGHLQPAHRTPRFRANRVTRYQSTSLLVFEDVTKLKVRRDTQPLSLSRE
ncbi:hypothetical protein SAMN05421753_1243 [Planctomicrobium piriforme]|uniref:Uncharacterized protein n=1 Tax=Planctomicrobium piriforme TaxID=1576369 RepID=A0A1I3SH82_9PLAN|nr:hypothetical protein SAMN05421753_1243 [Planctomicrobium piriforme]